jgi:hypothetical protein
MLTVSLQKTPSSAAFVPPVDVSPPAGFDVAPEVSELQPQSPAAATNAKTTLIGMLISDTHEGVKARSLIQMNECPVDADWQS